MELVPLTFPFGYLAVMLNVPELATVVIVLMTVDELVETLVSGPVPPLVTVKVVLAELL